ncbi:colicin transporter [Bifidobacterium tissieri]|uniref:Colicin transporter n=1 Tax=Bifidobacterium tissieri TaxID=1630162 RepID=A0A261FHG1_9BIFI|nr:hypothetical protein [Bifidobacterium tissieri]OZG58455.1 colicin transporter [Bifidobacterium tissieri]
MTDSNDDETTRNAIAAPTDSEDGSISEAKATRNDDSANEGNSTNKDGSSAKHPRRKAIAAGVGIAIMLALAGGVYAYMSRSAHEAALSDCEASISTVTKTMSLWDDARKDADETATITADQVADSATVDTLAKLYTTKDAKPQACNASDSTSTLRETTDHNKSLAGKYSDLVKRIDPAVDAVQASQALKTLTNTIGNGQSLLDSSNGQVKDESTRGVLQTAINEANDLSKNENATTQQLSDAKIKLDDAMNAVNQSVQERQADEQAAAEAATKAAAQAQAKSQMSTNNSTTGSSTANNRTTTNSTTSNGPSGNSNSGSNAASDTGTSNGTQNTTPNQSGSQSSGNGTSTQPPCNGTLENGHCWVDFGPGWSGDGWKID